MEIYGNKFSNTQSHLIDHLSVVYLLIHRDCKLMCIAFERDMHYWVDFKLSKTAGLWLLFVKVYNYTKAYYLISLFATTSSLGDVQLGSVSLTSCLHQMQTHNWVQLLNRECKYVPTHGNSKYNIHMLV